MDDGGSLGEALMTLADFLAAHAEPIGAALFTLLGRASLERENELLREAIARREQEAAHLARTVAAIAAERDGAVLVMDGGPSDLSAAAWVAANTRGE